MDVVGCVFYKKIEYKKQMIKIKQQREKHEREGVVAEIRKRKKNFLKREREREKVYKNNSYSIVVIRIVAITIVITKLYILMFFSQVSI